MFEIGAGSVVINGKIGSIIQGATVDKRAVRVRDNLEANALLLENNTESVMFISCDLAVLKSDFIIPVRKLIADKTGIPERNIIIACTHTHNGPSVLQTCYTKPIDFDYLDSLSDSLLQVAQTSMDSRKPAKIGWSKGHAKIGYNRRCCWADGTHSMHGDSKREDFTGIEGLADDGHYVLCAIDYDNNPVAILHSNNCHATHFYGSDFFSADYPGASRSFLRDTFGDIPVLYLNGAIGDVGPDNQLHNNSVCSGEKSMLRVAHIITGETMKQIAEMSFHDNPILIHSFEDIKIPVKLPEQEALKQAKAILAKVDNGEDVNIWDQLFAFGTVDLDKCFGEKPIDIVPVHVVNIGDMAFVTQPCELFCHFALEIKRRSPIPCTVTVGLADGYGGYCPTFEGIIGGGYSGKPISWCRLANEAGYTIVDESCRLLFESAKKK